MIHGGELFNIKILEIDRELTKFDATEGSNHEQKFLPNEVNTLEPFLEKFPNKTPIPISNSVSHDPVTISPSVHATPSILGDILNITIDTATGKNQGSKKWKKIARQKQDVGVLVILSKRNNGGEDYNDLPNKRRSDSQNDQENSIRLVEAALSPHQGQ